jgi:hypothetical protein
MSTLITALLIIIGAIGIPLIFILINNKKSKRRNETVFGLLRQEGSKKGLSFSSHELLRNKLVGLDSIKQEVVVLDFENPGNVICIAITDIRNCSIEKKYQSIVIGTEKKPKLEPHLQRIDLKFVFNNSCEPVSISFYDSDINSIYEMSELEEKAKTWEAALSKMIVTSKSKGVATPS